MAEHEYCPECHQFLGSGDWHHCPNCGAGFESDAEDDECCPECGEYLGDADADHCPHCDADLDTA